MTLEIVLPALPGGAARVLRWLVAEGAAVAAGAPLVIVLTGRAEVALPAPAAGVLGGAAPEGATVEPGGLLGRLAPAERRGEQTQRGAPPASAAAHPEAGAPRLRATPLARSIARAHGVELGDLAGTGPGGRVRAADVRAALAPQPAAPSPPAPPATPTPSVLPSSLPLSPPPLARPIASATFELDAGPALARAAALSGQLTRLGLRVSLLACVVEAAAAALAEHPYLNARWDDDAILLRRRIHVAAAQPGGESGLRWALVEDAGDLTLRGLARALGGGAGCELGRATFAVVCMEGGASWQSARAPLPGTAAALLVGAPARRAVAVGAAVAAREVAALTLSYDARVLDHSHAAAFVRSLIARLERAR